MQTEADHGRTSLLTHSNEAGSSELTRALYGLRWEEHFPLSLGDGECVRCIDGVTARRFVSETISQIFHTSERPNALSEARNRYYAVAGDCFGFYDRDRLVGVFICTPTDWETYYLRYCALLPEYQSGERSVRFVLHIGEVLRRHGVIRLETDTSPDNAACMKAVLKMGFVACSLIMSEEWGGLVRFARQLAPENEKKFRERFCYGARSSRVPAEART